MNKLNWLNWKKVVSFLVILGFLVLLLYFVFLYRHIEKDKTAYFDETESFILAETDISKIDDIYHFQEEKSYYILYGEDNQGKQWVVFNPGKNKDADKVQMYPQAELQSKDDIETHWQSECDSCTLENSGPAMIKNEPLWELTYMDEQNRYVMEYISLKDGSTFEKLKLHRKYNKKG